MSDLPTTPTQNHVMGNEEQKSSRNIRCDRRDREIAGDSRVHEARRVSSTTLFAGAIEIAIEHEGLIYRLRRTSKGKLILTK